jgi:hypothetical protein
MVGDEMDDFALALDGDHAGARTMRRCRSDRVDNGAPYHPRESSAKLGVQKCVSIGVRKVAIDRVHVHGQVSTHHEAPRHFPSRHSAA